MKKIEDEGLGMGFMDFLDDIEVNASKKISDFQVPKEEYKFNKKEFEVALGESDFE